MFFLRFTGFVLLPLVWLLVVLPLGCSTSSCPEGTTETEDGACLAPDAGSTLYDGGTCEPCATGTYCDFGTLACVACLTNDHCSGDTPGCHPQSNTCVECVNNTYCGDTTPICNTETSLCARCWEDDVSVCAASMNQCDFTTGLCVGCIADSHCSEAMAAQCNLTTNTCTGCTTDAQCVGVVTAPAQWRCKTADAECVECLTDAECDGDTPLCDTGENSCVACLLDSDCTSPTAAKCDTSTNLCVGCDGNSQCTGVMNGAVTVGVCDTGNSRCEECTGSDTSGCGGNECTTGLLCSAYGAAAQTSCQPCDMDANCGTADHFCVAMEYLSAAHPDTNTDSVSDHGYCLETTTGGCPLQYKDNLVGRTSLSGVTGSIYCSPREALATCEAVLDLDSTCSGGMDSECAQPGGLCRTVASNANRCSYPCATTDDCPGSATICSNGMSGVNFCGGS